MKVMFMEETFIIRDDYKDMTDEQLTDILEDLCRVAEKHKCHLVCGAKLIEDTLD
ncbi:hypothetical protein Q9R38_26225 [Priestia aryabhattai]|uniref:hypothetical protein n=1 Tax=Priestia aryabhattai TaxID=412384 RepID=UPI002882C9C3|nr:hypothetical protein [Priestia aryabhattai]MDT0150042.1 hypothetical protein [Priestia aryabhattai]MDT0155612.1 hypothetical protein [Priestia aryabhattai]